MYVMVAIIAYNTITINAILNPLLCDKSSFIINLIFKHEPIIGGQDYGQSSKGWVNGAVLLRFGRELTGYALLN